MNGILIVNKPQGITSFDVVAAVKKNLKIKKAGHCGTLDPLATGVLPVLLGKATKALSLLPETGKEYIAEFQLGIISDTQDITGEFLKKEEFTAKTWFNKQFLPYFDENERKITFKAGFAKVTEPEIKKALKKFEGDGLQVPPMYSALKQNGKRLYELARMGLEVERPARPVNISKIKLLEFLPSCGKGKILVSCSKGTYIRTICSDLGEELGCGAVMSALVRTQSTGFSLEQSVTICQLEQDPSFVKEMILPLDSAFKEYPGANISSGQAVRFCNGGKLDMARVNAEYHENANGEKIVLRVYDDEQNFLGLGLILPKTGELSVIKNLS